MTLRGAVHGVYDGNDRIFEVAGACSVGRRSLSERSVCPQPESFGAQQRVRLGCEGEWFDGKSTRDSG